MHDGCATRVLPARLLHLRTKDAGVFAEGNPAWANRWRRINLNHFLRLNRCLRSPRHHSPTCKPELRAESDAFATARRPPLQQASMNYMTPAGAADGIDPPAATHAHGLPHSMKPGAANLEPAWIEDRLARKNYDFGPDAIYLHWCASRHALRDLKVAGHTASGT